MSVIGTFKKTGEKYVGEIKTLRLEINQVELIPVDVMTERGPKYRVIGDGAEIGAAWEKTSQQSRSYLSVTMDDPSFPAPLNTSLFESEQEPGTYRLIWDRPRPQ